MAENQSEQTIETSVEPTTIEPSTAENLSEEPKKLSPEEEAVLEKKRATFRKLHDYFGEQDIYSAGADLQALRALVESAYERYGKKVLISELGLEPTTKEVDEFLAILSESSVNEAKDYANALFNAIEQDKYSKTKHLKVKDMDIVLL